MKLKSAGLFVLAALLIASLAACSSATKATKSQTAPAQSAQAASKPFSGDAGKFKSSMPSTAAGKESKPMVTLNDIHFDYDRYVIRPTDTQILKQDYAWFKTNPGDHVTIEGNCDERGSIEYNLALGQKRADATKNYLVTLGVPANLLKTVSYGKEKPIDPGHDEHAWAKNRRAHLAPQKL